MRHRCHALGCKTACSTRHLMCTRHWRMVPAELQAEVYRTVVLREKDAVNATWAPWWRAQAKAIESVAKQEQPGWDSTAYMRRELGFADTLEART